MLIGEEFMYAESNISTTNQFTKGLGDQTMQGKVHEAKTVIRFLTENRHAFLKRKTSVKCLVLYKIKIQKRTITNNTGLLRIL